MKQKQHILKSSGEVEPFSMRKLCRSIERTGLRPKYCHQISSEVAHSIKSGATTKEIFKKTFRLVKKHSKVAAIHYSLKASILELGPTGYEFEHFVSRYFSEIGFDTYTGIVMQGEFVTHEVDVIASKPNFQAYVECKFHNNTGRKNDIKTVLYVKARWDDLKNGPDGKYLREYYVCSNTAFSKDAITYAEGVGLKLLGVNAPPEESFLEKIIKHKLYPITSLKKLKKSICKELLLKQIILCKELLEKRAVLISLGLTNEEVDAIFEDVHQLLK